VLCFGITNMRRIRLFIYELFRLAVIGDSWIERITKWTLLLLTAFGVSYTSFWHPKLIIHIVILISYYAGIISHIAWIKSEKPLLFVGETLEKDSAYLTWRLRIVNEWNASVAICVAMKGIYCDREGVVIEETLFPIKLEWSHHDNVDTLKLGSKEEATVTVFKLELEQTSHQLFLRIWGATYRGFLIYLQDFQNVRCHLEIYCPEFDVSILRKFLLEKDDNDITNIKVSIIDVKTHKN
jgi:hypothetical protein